MCDCAKSYRLALNFSMNPGWGYLPRPSLEISAKSHAQFFGYEPKQDFKYNSGNKNVWLCKILPFGAQFFGESWVGIPSPTFPRNFGQITRAVF